MSNRDAILGRLRKAPRPFTDLPPITTRRPMAPVEETSLQETFIEQAQKLTCTVQVCGGTEEAIQYILALIGSDKSVSSWDTLPLPGLTKALADAGIQIAAADDPAVRIGITGADAALAGTGSLVLASGPGKSRLVSLLPFIHVAVITADQILPNMESWAAQQRQLGLDHFQQTSNVLVISGPSRTADIAMQLVLGAHGPAEVNIVILP